jgi:hypothetical protein
MMVDGTNLFDKENLLSSGPPTISCTLYDFRRFVIECSNFMHVYEVRPCKDKRGVTY